MGSLVGFSGVGGKVGNMTKQTSWDFPLTCTVLQKGCALLLPFLVRRQTAGPLALLQNPTDDAKRRLRPAETDSRNTAMTSGEKNQPQTLSLQGLLPFPMREDGTPIFPVQG